MEIAVGKFRLYENLKNVIFIFRSSRNINIREYGKIASLNTAHIFLSNFLIFSRYQMLFNSFVFTSPRKVCLDGTKIQFGINLALLCLKLYLNFVKFAGSDLSRQ